jgi:hypothetical protein
MSLSRPFSLLAAGVVLVGCHEPNPVNSGAPDPRASRSATFAVTAGNYGASGGGYYEFAGFPVQFAFSAVQSPEGKAAGQFHIYLDEGDGLTVDVAGEVICVTHDPVNHRAWIGAVVTRNSSTDPTLQTDIHEVGDDVWFRVVDNGAEDRTSFTGFKGAAGVQTSPEYCAVQLWPADNARTWPVTQGNISVRP